MEVWTIKVECVFGMYLKAESAKMCEIQSTCDLDELCYFILDSYEFDYDHLHEFFLSRRAMGSKKITIEDERTTLENVFPLEKPKQLFMHFDFGADWIFKITRNRKKAEFSENISYPRVMEHIGKNPEQYPMYEEYE